MSRGYEFRSFCYSGPVIAQRARTLQLWPGVPGRWWRWVYDGRAMAGEEKWRTKDLRLRSRAGQSIKKGRWSFIILYENTTYILYFTCLCERVWDTRVYWTYERGLDVYAVGDSEKNNTISPRNKVHLVTIQHIMASVVHGREYYSIGWIALFKNKNIPTKRQRRIYRVFLFNHVRMW